MGDSHHRRGMWLKSQGIALKWGMGSCPPEGGWLPHGSDIPSPHPLGMGEKGTCALVVRSWPWLFAGRKAIQKLSPIIQKTILSQVLEFWGLTNGYTIHPEGGHNGVSSNLNSLLFRCHRTRWCRFGTNKLLARSRNVF